MLIRSENNLGFSKHAKRRASFMRKYRATDDDPKRKVIMESMQRDIQEHKRIPSKSCIITWLNKVSCIRINLIKGQAKHYKVLAKSNTQIEKELDLQKFLHRVRLQATATLGLLTR